MSLLRKALENIAIFVLVAGIYVGFGVVLLVCATKIVKWAWGA